MSLLVWRRKRGLVWVSLVGLAVPFAGASQSPCDFTPAESHYAHLNVQSSYQWFEDQFSPPHTSASTGSLLVDSSEIYDSVASGYELDGNSRIAFSPTGLDLSLTGSGNLKNYLQEDTFGIGALSLRLTLSEGFEGELTGGIGTGRFRDVTPLAKAIRIQNQFLDEGILVGPMADDLLQAVAQAIGAVGPSSSERLATLERQVEATGLVQGGTLGAHALTEIEDILASTEEARLCGWDVQARAGIAVSVVPELTLSEAIALSWNYAVVPDPVSQWQASANWVSGLRFFDRYAFTASVSYGRRFGDIWRIRASYDFSRDLLWNSAHTTPFDHHLASATLISQLSAQLSLTASFELEFETGYDQPTKTLTLHLSYDVL
jgi:hypothetical protein